MASAFQDNSHYEPSSPRTSVHGGRGDAVQDGQADEGVRDSSSGDHVREKAPPPVPLTKKQKVKRHCGRFKWWYLAGFIIFNAIFLPILFLVILPAIVQRIVDDQSMPVKGGAFVANSPTELTVSLETSLNTPLPARIDPLTLFLYNKGTPEFSPFLNLTLPEQYLKGDTPIIVTNQTVTITNDTELISWFDNVFNLPQVDLSVRGDSTVHLGALHSNAHIDKTISVQSLNQLNGFGIIDLRLVMPPDENGNNIKGTLNLPNWGSLTLGLGNISLNLMSGDVRLGLLTVYDVVIPPGNNTRSFDGQLYLNELAQNFGEILASQADALNDGKIQIDATGNATMVNGQHIPFVEAILNKKRVTSYVPVTKLLSDVVNSIAGSDGDASLVDILGEVFGNTTLIDQIANRFNKNGTVATTKFKRSAPLGKQGGAAGLNLLKLGMKMALAKF
ncbi:hypothetical protein JX265_011057 [Neoarthrinium moseri]|uniref:Uncharacterized protein n=1 Tax=Neoarthrinium moseri TaxID=1658444 RepID=A0A9P9WCS3_9PEZI|nr:uncharacterized protein JN550_005039 [Neoarthrinium moseri]KAI1857642.1 hypothetical protein JX265_011057 [Neoarthrinium moseri]KAI1870496.1 hypothetical protein JN550_005039 [Neoarthrinium moseri]